MRAFFEEIGDNDAVYVLRRVPDPRRAGCYTLDRRFRYEDPLRSDRHFVVPDDTHSFVSDLASVPPVATWLVPKDGTHTPAALLHDALVSRNYIGAPIARDDADQVFREAMRYLDVPPIRRWMMWAATSLATLVSRGPGRWYWFWRVQLPIVIGVLVVTGFVSVLDLADIHAVRVPLTGVTVGTDLPWMGDADAGSELFGGLLAAAVAAVVTPLLFGRRWRVGLVVGLATIPLAFPLVVAAFAYAGYSAVELVAYALAHATKGGREQDTGPIVRPPIVRRM